MTPIPHKVADIIPRAHGKNLVMLQCGHEFTCDQSAGGPATYNLPTNTHFTQMMQCPECDKIRKERFLDKR